MQSLEDAKKLTRILHVKTSSIVLNVEDGLFAILSTSQFDVGLVLIYREFPRIAYQVFQQGAHQDPVRPYDQTFWDDKTS